MAQSMEEIAKELVVAWLSHNDLRFDFENPAKAGEDIAKIYKAVLQAVREGSESRQSWPQGATVVIEGQSR
jgi:hypothetical protein